MTTPARSQGQQAQTQQATAKKEDKEPGRFSVHLSHPAERKKVVFSSISERRARRWMANHFPRGTEAYLETPDGKFESYEQERTGAHGEDAERWAEFDPESYRPPEEQSPPGEAQWQDVEA